MAARSKAKPVRKAEDLFPEAFTVRDNILLLSRIYGVTFDEIARAMGKSIETWYRRIRQPWTLNEYEKRMIADTLHTTVAALYTNVGQQIADAMQISDV